MMLFGLIAVAMTFYFLFLKGESIPTLLLILLFSVIGMGGSYTVAWYGIRINTFPTPDPSHLWPANHGDGVISRCARMSVGFSLYPSNAS